MGQYDGPHRHFHVECRETTDGLRWTVTVYDVHKGKRRFSRLMPPRSLTWGSRPLSGIEVDLRVARALQREFGA